MLKPGSAWAEEVWRSGPVLALGSPELRRAVVLGVPGARDLGVRGAEWKDEDEAKLVRALETRRGLSTELATAAARWQPRRPRGCVV